MEKVENKLLVVVDMQNDFVSGSLGSADAEAIVSSVCSKIDGWNGFVCFTYDTHDENYLNTLEGKKLPVPHCVKGTDGWLLQEEINSRRWSMGAGNPKFHIEKQTFGSFELVEFARDMRFDSIELVGLCTDICVISNAILLRAGLPDTPIFVDAACCAGVTPETHRHALSVMKRCHIDILND